MMKKLLVYICTLIMALMFASCQTSPKLTSEETQLVQESINLNGTWNSTTKWSNEVDSGTYYSEYEIIQKGNEIIINITNGSEDGSKYHGTLKGNIVYLEPSGFTGPKGYDVSMPVREMHISQDQNTLTIENQFTYEARDESGFGSAEVTITRK